MTVINEINEQKFTFNGIEYFKNFMPYVVGDKIRILNVYDSSIELTDFPTLYSDFEVDGNTFASVSLLQTALLPVLYTRNSLGVDNAFLNLTDTPSTYVGQAGKVATVNGTEDALEFTVPSGGSSHITLIDRVTTDQTLQSLSGTNVALYTYMIPANTFTVGDVIQVKAISNKTGTAGGYFLRYYINTVNDVNGVGVKFLAFINTSTSNRPPAYLKRLFLVKPSYTRHLTNGVSYPDGFSFANPLNFTDSVIDWTVDQYFFVAASGTAPDQAQLIYFEMTKQ